MIELNGGLSPHERGDLQVRDALRGGRPLGEDEQGAEPMVAWAMAHAATSHLERVFELRRNEPNKVEAVLLDGRLVMTTPGTVDRNGYVTSYNEMSNMVKQTYARVAEIQIGYDILTAEANDFEMRAKIARQKASEILSSW